MTDLPGENMQFQPCPAALEPVPQRITVRIGDALVTETTRTLRVPV